MRYVIAAALMAAVSLPANAARLVTLDIPEGIAGIEHVDGLRRGIATGSEIGPVRLQLGDGSWAAITLDAGSLRLSPAVAPVSRHAAPPDALPDSSPTWAGGNIRLAWLVEPTQRYRHGILGDGVEAASLRLQGPDGARAELRLGRASVFEDLRVRIVDLNGDGQDEAVVVRTYLKTGASLAVYGLDDGRVIRLAETPPIGLTHRWLNPAAVADFDGDGIAEIAFVETPHIGGTLRLFEFDGEELIQKYESFGFSNHAIGSRVQDMAAVIDWNGDGILDLAIPDARRSALRIVTFADGQISDLDNVQHPVQITSAVRAADLNGDGRAELIYALANNKLVVVQP
ncbi:MAG: FG-GAP repeat domain-containing protein [Alphaproteobacteria bacterium]